ncbi:MAG: methyltransferase domain-containing protein [Desulfarculaceae bacterium]|jgi:2-polyprenyl-3-methyl-5-hydroxy-6-metoxy-1,4-benzoquinol methylase
MKTPLTSQGEAPGSTGAWERLRRRFDLQKAEFALDGIRLSLPEMADPLAYLDHRLANGYRQLKDLPLWTKVWPASLVLAQLAASLKFAGGDSVLELGAGMGLPGLVAAAKGAKVVLTDFDSDALEFAQAAVEINRLEERVQVRALDWNQDVSALGKFTTVLGAEILYSEELFPQVTRVLATLLAPGGSIFLSHQEQPAAPRFFASIRDRFEIRSNCRTLRGEDGVEKVFLHCLRLPGAPGALARN